MTDRIHLNNPEETLAGMLELLSSSRRMVHLYAPAVNPTLFNRSEFIATVRCRIADQPRMRFFMILPEGQQWHRQCPRLVHLLERLKTPLMSRTLPRTEPRSRPQFRQLFVIGDQKSLLCLSDPHRMIGNMEPAGHGHSKSLLAFFEEIWEKSAPDPELRRIYI